MFDSDKKGKLKMKFGIIGYQHFHIDYFINLMLKHGHEFVGVNDDDENAAHKCAERYKVSAFDKRESFMERSIDIIGTADIPYKRIEILEWAERNNLHFVSDKALAINREGLEKLERVVSGKRIKIGMILDFRYNGLLQKLKEEIDNGVLGTLVNVIVMNPHKLRPETRPEWFWNTNKAGSVITDLMIHGVDIFRWLTNSEIASGKVSLGKGTRELPAGFNDYGKAFLEAESNVSGTVYADWLTPDNYFTWSDYRVFCHGTEGFAEVRLTGDHTHREPALFINSIKYKDTQVWEKLPSALDIVQDISNQINGTDEAFLTPEDILASLRSCIELQETLKN